MEKFKVSFEANNQQLKSIGTKHASDTYADIEATFVLGEKWTDMDSVSAVWWNDFTRIATVLDSQGKCIVPHEVLARKGCVRVNLVGSIVEGDELITRLTSYSAEAVQVNEKIKLTGSETSEITPSQYEQFVANVKADADRAEAGATASEQSAQSASESATASANSATSSAQSASDSAESAQNASESAQSAENAKDDAEDARDEILGMRATAETLEAGSDATASYSDGLLTLGIPRGDQGIQGIQGETGATPNLTIGTVETLEPTEDATATITGTAEEPILNLGIPKGDTGEVSLENLEALLPTDTASGDIVTIPDGQPVIPAESLKVALEPIQSGSGTPSPDNVRPISGHTECVTSVSGKNVLALPIYYRANTRVPELFFIKAGTYAISYSVTGATSWRLGMWMRDKDGNNISDYAKRPYPYFSWYENPGYWMDGGNGTLTSRTITIVEDCYVRFFFAIGDTSSSTVFSNQMLELGTTVTDYEPYQGETYTTALGQTVYGGTLDVVSGEMVVDRASVTLNGSSTWVTQDTLTNTKHYSCDISGITASTGVYSDDVIGDSMPTIASNVDSVHMNHRNVAIHVWIPKDITPSTYFADNPLQVCYELATPQTYQLTPQEIRLLLGTNNIWSDGKVTLTYSADIQRYIEKKLNGNSTTLTMSRPMVQTETTETE